MPAAPAIAAALNQPVTPPMRMKSNVPLCVFLGGWSALSERTIVMGFSSMHFARCSADKSDHALLVRLPRLGELALTELCDVLAVAQQWFARQQSF